MGRASSKRRRMKTIKAITDALPKVDPDLAAHMYDRQIRPQERARELRKSGVDVDVAIVNTSASATGFPVECYGCGRKATLPFDPGGKEVLCPNCQRG